MPYIEMTRHLRTVTALVVTAVGLVTAGAASGVNPPTPDTGQAVTVIQLPRITITDASGATRTVDLGALTAQAISDTGLAAALGVNGGNVLGTPLPGWGVDTAGGPQSGDHGIAATVSGSAADIGLVGYDVAAAGHTAHASLDSLTGTASTSPLDVEVDLGQHGVDATVQPDTSSSAISLTVTGLKVGMGDLLPTGVLDAMPLTGLINLVSSLGLSLPVGAGGVVNQLNSLTTELADVTSAADDLNTADSALATLLASIPSTSAAQQQLTDAQTQLSNDLAVLSAAQQQLGVDTAAAQSPVAQVAAANDAVTALTAQVNALSAQLASLLGDPLQAVLAGQVTAQLQDAQNQLTAAQTTATQLQTQLDQANATVTADQQLVMTATQQVSSDQAAVTAAQSALDALAAAVAAGNQAVADAQTTVDQLTTTLTDLINGLTADLGGLPDLSAVRSQLVAALTAAPLLDVGTLGATVSSTATDGSGAGSVSCTVTGASVLGQAIPVGPCSSLVSSFAAITSAVSSALAQLPLAQPLSPSLDGLAESTAGGPAAPDDVDSTASAGLTPLHLALPSGALSALTDSAVSALTAALTPAQQSLAGLGLPALTSALTGSLGTFATTLAAMPSGSGLAGLHTIGVDVSLVGLSTSALHHRSLAAPPAAGASGTPSSRPAGSSSGPASGPSAGGAGGAGATAGGGGTTSNPAEPAEHTDPPTKAPGVGPPRRGGGPPHPTKHK